MLHLPPLNQNATFSNRKSFSVAYLWALLKDVLCFAPMPLPPQNVSFYKLCMRRPELSLIARSGHIRKARKRGKLGWNEAGDRTRPGQANGESKETWKQKSSATQRKAAERHLNFWTSLISRRVWHIVSARDGQRQILRGSCGFSSLWNWKHFPSLKKLSAGNQLIAVRSMATISSALVLSFYRWVAKGSAIFVIIVISSMFPPLIILVSCPFGCFIISWPGGN